MPRLSGKAAIVTGGSHGIGAATCKALAREGAAVAVTDVLDDDGRMIAEHINSTGGDARFWHLDVTDEAAVEHVLGEVANRMTRPTSPRRWSGIWRRRSASGSTCSTVTIGLAVLAVGIA